MQTRESVVAKLRQMGVTTFRRVGPYLIAGGMATNLYILLASKYVQETQTCENARSDLDANASVLAILNAVLVADTGLYVFNVTGAVRAIVIPTTHWSYGKVAELFPRLPTLSEFQLKSLEIWEGELTQAISTGMFIRMLPLSAKVTTPFLPISLLPIGRIYLKHRLHNYPGSATYQQYHEIYPDRAWLANILAAVESISSGVNLGGAMNALSYFLINALYDSSHEKDWEYQSLVMNIMTAVGMVAGMASIFNARAHRGVNHAAQTLEMFYLICMPLISLSMCFAPQLENMSTFMQESIYVVLGIAAFSLLMAEANTRLTAKLEDDTVKVEEVDSEEESKEDYITFPPRETVITNTGYGTFFAESSAITINDEAETTKLKSPSPSLSEEEDA